MNFFKSVAQEMKKVTWPTSEELTKYTIIVVSTILVVGFFLGLTDFGISELFKWIFSLAA